MRWRKFNDIRGVLRLLPILALLPAAACQNDNRISLAELNQIERELSDRPAVPVELKELALTDFRPYEIRSGDVLTVKMIGLLEDRYTPTDLQFRVHSDGMIALPVVGPIKVQGLTLGQAEEAIIAAHVPDVVKDLSVFVELNNPENTTVLVRGAVEYPGLVRLKQNERNPLYALASAGGFSFSGSGRVRLRPIRSQREEVVYDFNDVNDVRRALLGPPLESGDVLVVEASRENNIYVTGLVNLPGAIPVPAQTSLSVERVIAASGGLREYLHVKEATLVRQLANGDQVRVKLNLDEIHSGEAPDLALRSGDILQIPHTPDTLFQEWFVRNVMIGPFSVGVRYDPLAQYNANRALKNDRMRQSISDSLGSAIPSMLMPALVP